MAYDVFGMGNPLMDILMQVEDDFLSELELNKGQFNLIDKKRMEVIESKIDSLDKKEVPGGAVANTIAVLSQLGLKTVFFGSVGEDKIGNEYVSLTNEYGTVSDIKQTSEDLTGVAITFITPDNERTFAVYLGASNKVNPELVDEEFIKQSKFVYLCGYQLEDSALKETALTVLNIAKENDVKIAIDLADPGVVSRNKEFMQNVVEEYADVLFANEEESMALTGLEPEEAVNKLSEQVEIAIVKIGKNGSLIMQENTLTKASALLVEAVDTTGAGDSYAGGFLYGLVKNHDVKTCADIGSYISAQVVKKIGARLDAIAFDELEAHAFDNNNNYK